MKLRRRTKGSGDRADAARLRTRRRFARRQWARRWGAWKFVLGLLSVVVLTGVAAWLVGFSDTMSVHQVRVVGVDYLTPDQVRRAASVPPGTQVAFVEVDKVRERVSALAPVAEVDVSRDWPDGVLIKVTERVPVALADLGGTWRGMDRTGVVFRDYKRPPANLPRVQVLDGAGRDAMAEAASVIGALPGPLAAGVDHISVRTVDEIALALKDGRTVDWGSAEDSALKAKALSALMKARPSAGTYDVSVPEQPLVRG